jgi:hypothetical protein
VLFFRFLNFKKFFFSFSLVDIICDKMSESGEHDASGAGGAGVGGQSSMSGGPNVRGGGGTAGATRLTDGSSSNGPKSDSCQC